MERIRDFQQNKNKRDLQPTLQRCPYHWRRVGIVLDMKEYDVTKLPFTSISRENWEMLVELDKDSLYDIIQKIGNYVLTGEKCDCGDTLSKIVCTQILNSIDKKGEAYFKTTGNLKGKKKENFPLKKEKEPVASIEPEPTPDQEPAAELNQACQKDDDALFDEFLSDPTMDYSSLVTDISYFKVRKRNELNNLFIALGKRYGPEQIIQILQEKWTNKINKMELEE